MSLNHVSMWTDNGFQPTSPQQAAMIHPYGASSRSGLFVCRLCGQYVSFVQNSWKTHFFKHSRGEEEKDCPERMDRSNNSVSIQQKQHSLPLQLTVNSADSFVLSIGMILPPIITHADGIIEIMPIGFHKPYTFRADQLANDNITYFSIGQDIAKKFHLSFHAYNPETPQNLFPSVIDGIPDEGCLFRITANSRCGKRIPQGANVQAFTDYYLLIKRTVSLSRREQMSIQCEQVCSHIILYHNWYVYHIRATAFDETAAEFFLQFRCILTEATVSLLPIWPIHINSPYITYHPDFKMWFYLNGQDVSAQSFPSGSIDRYPCKTNEEQVLGVYCSTRQQTLLAGKSKILRFTYLWIDPLHTQTDLPSVNVTDIDGNRINDGDINTLPKQGIIRILSPFDGKVIIKESGIVSEIRILKANQTIEIDHIINSISIQVLQGLDTIWKGVFRLQQKTASSDDETLYQQLLICRGTMIPFSHRCGAWISYMKEMPRVKHWLINRIRCGFISEDAFKILIQFANGKRWHYDNF